jgi:GrpB-like predicted nucleotidyltransferase (UPF0157 family)
MRILITPYNPKWVEEFNRIKVELTKLLQGYFLAIEHIGSTSVPGLAAKPVIDIQIGLEKEEYLDQVVPLMLQHQRYIYYKAFNPYLPNRRLFVRLKDDAPMDSFPNTFSDIEAIPHEAINPLRFAHVHIWPVDSPDWTRHIAFREYLKAHDSVRLEYEELKKQLSQQEWEHGMAYNDGKDVFIKREEKKAVAWYRSQP